MRTRFTLSLYSTLLIALSGVTAGAARADEADPFQMDGGHWMSLDHYSDNVKRSRPVGDEALAPPPVDAPVLSSTAPPSTTAPAAGGQNAPQQIAAPLRPLDLPLLPGINKGFEVEVNSTTDYMNSSGKARIVTDKDGEADLHLQEQNWQDAAEAARQHADQRAAAENDSGDQVALNVRMSFLPSPLITPVFAPPRAKAPRPAEVPVKIKPPSAPETQKSPAECAAVDTYRKHQLEAIQSDRETLKALQTAISDLGLQKQLNFLAGGDIPANAATAQSSAAATPGVATP